MHVKPITNKLDFALKLQFTGWERGKGHVLVTLWHIMCMLIMLFIVTVLLPCMSATRLCCLNAEASIESRDVSPGPCYNPSVSMVNSKHPNSGSFSFGLGGRTPLYTVKF